MTPKRQKIILKAKEMTPRNGEYDTKDDTKNDAKNGTLTADLQ